MLDEEAPARLAIPGAAALAARSLPARAPSDRRIADGSVPPVARLSSGSYRVVVERSPVALERHRAAWVDLAGATAHPNPFLEPFMLLPALRFLPGGAGVEVALVYRNDLLCGLAPLAYTRRYRGLPVAARTLWQYAHCFDATPLLRAGHEQAAVGTLIDALTDDLPLLELRTLAAGGPAAGALIDAVNQRGLEVSVSGRHTRAFLHRAADADSYREAAISSGKRKELRRQERRLAELGPLVYDTLPEGAPLADWTAEFLAVEATGWKGRAGSALAASEADRSYFAAVTEAAYAQGRLAMLALRIAGRPAAMKCNLLAADGAFAFKIGYDEGLARYSPGVLLELANIDWLHARPGLRWMDSCAAWDHPMINHLWRERVGFETVLIATRRSWAAAAFVAATPFLRWARKHMSPKLEETRP
jgi:CelD/BcsL family acetyltransferase involved in cellulose biosynthesis